MHPFLEVYVPSTVGNGIEQSFRLIFRPFGTDQHGELSNQQSVTRKPICVSSQQGNRRLQFLRSFHKELHLLDPFLQSAIWMRLEKLVLSLKKWLPFKWQSGLSCHNCSGGSYKISSCQCPTKLCEVSSSHKIRTLGCSDEIDLILGHFSITVAIAGRWYAVSARNTAGCCQHRDQINCVSAAPVTTSFAPSRRARRLPISPLPSPLLVCNPGKSLFLLLQVSFLS